MHRRAAAALALATILAPGPVLGSQAAARTFQTRLSTVPIDLAMARTIAGSGSVTATLDGRTLVITGTFTGLKSPATVVRLHRGPNRGLRGPAIGDLTASGGVSGEISGRVELTTAQVEDLRRGRLYVQLHSEEAAEGNLWGRLAGK